MNLLKLIWALIKSFFSRKPRIAIGVPEVNPHPVPLLIEEPKHDLPIAPPKVLEVATQIETTAVIEEPCPHDKFEHEAMLPSLDASFLECTRSTSKYRCHKNTDPDRTHGIHFLCPCKKHYVTCLFKHPSVKADNTPSERWTRENAVYGLSKITLVEPVETSCGLLMVIKDGVVKW